MDGRLLAKRRTTRSAQRTKGGTRPRTTEYGSMEVWNAASSPSERTQLPLASPQKMKSRRPIPGSPPQTPRRTKRRARRRFCWPRCATRPRERRAVRHQGMGNAGAQNISLAAQTGRGKSAIRATPTVCRNTRDARVRGDGSSGCVRVPSAALPKRRRYPPCKPKPPHSLSRPCLSSIRNCSAPMCSFEKHPDETGFARALGRQWLA